MVAGPGVALLLARKSSYGILQMIIVLHCHSLLLFVVDEMRVTNDVCSYSK